MHKTHKVRCRAIVTHDEKLLIVKNSRGSGYYALPGGHLDVGENPVECIHRELVEELGVEPVVGDLLYVYTFMNGEGEQSVEFFFEISNGADFLVHEHHKKTHAHELSEARWISKDDDVHMLPKEIHSDFKAGKIRGEDVRFVNG